jgi:indolepyruvate ferredoxin oxidoreductase beta subunit
MKNNIILTGVGGQGIVTAAKILGKASIKAGFDCYVSEVHGMAQRGGSVICTVRMGDIYGPLIEKGTANAIISAEPIEALRCINYSNNKTKIIVDINPVIPYTVSVGTDKYPNLDEVYDELEKFGILHKIDANKIAEESGNIITKNIVLLGALAASKALMFESDVLLSTILDNFPKKFIKTNKKAFEGGLKSIINK